MEVFCRDVIVHYAGNWPQSVLKDLLREKITIADALNFVSFNTLKPEFIVAHTLPFQNPDSINSIFSKLNGGKDFFDMLDKYDSTTIEGDEPFPASALALPLGWRKILYQLYDLRNKVVHEDVKRTVSKKEMRNYSNVLVTLTLTMEKVLNRELNMPPELSL